MGDLLALGAKKLLLGIGGLAIALGWMTISGGSDVDFEELDRVPAVAFGGGAGTIMVEIETNQPARIKTSFSQCDDETEEGSELYASEDIHPGPFIRSVDIAPDTYLYFEVGVPDATVGATLSMIVYLDGEEVYREDDRLTEPLGENYAFFVQFEANSIDQVREWMD